MKPAKVLLVDDEVELAEAIVQRLKIRRYAARAAFSATWRNLLPNLLAAALFLTATALAAIVVTLVGSVVLVALGMVSSALALAVGLLAGFAFVSAVLVVVCGGGYLIWRDTFGDSGDSATPPAPAHRLEA